MSPLFVLNSCPELSVVLQKNPSAHTNALDHSGNNIKNEDVNF